MQKKTSVQKKTKKQSALLKKRKLSSYVRKYVLSIIFAFVVFLVTSLLLSQQRTQLICANSKSCGSDLSFKIENNAVGTFAGKKVYPPKIEQTSELFNFSVLGISTVSGEKHIFIDLSTQTLIAYQGTTQILK